MNECGPVKEIDILIPLYVSLDVNWDCKHLVSLLL